MDNLPPMDKGFAQIPIEDFMMLWDAKKALDKDYPFIISSGGYSERVMYKAAEYTEVLKVFEKEIEELKNINSDLRIKLNKPSFIIQKHWYQFWK